MARNDATRAGSEVLRPLSLDLGLVGQFNAKAAKENPERYYLRFYEKAVSEI
jgi:hypothetical protein